MPTSDPSTRLSTIRTIAVVEVSSTSLMRCQNCCILFLESKATRGQTIAVGKEFDGILTGGQCCVDIPVDGDTGYLLTGILDVLAGRCGYALALKLERRPAAEQLSFGGSRDAYR